MPANKPDINWIWCRLLQYILCYRLLQTLIPVLHHIINGGDFHRSTTATEATWHYWSDLFFPDALDIFWLLCTYPITNGGPLALAALGFNHLYVFGSFYHSLLTCAEFMQILPFLSPAPPQPQCLSKPGVPQLSVFQLHVLLILSTKDCFYLHVDKFPYIAKVESTAWLEDEHW
jgi:hypothetical protein